MRGIIAKTAVFVAISAVIPGLAQTSPQSWPEVSKEAKPWTYWWWLGSTVDEANLTRELERYSKAGLGGVHIIPIYGARGYESRYIDYLSPNWMAMLSHTVSEAARLGMGVDMTLGTGWCFGGPEISEKLASVVAVPNRAASSDVTVSMRPTSKVKRASPGGEGYMLNPFYDEAIDTFLRRFTTAFDGYKGPRPRAVYHDSFEYQANWSPDLPEEFARRRGYRLEDEYATLFGKDKTDRAARLKSDYRETLSDLLLEDFTKRWVRWAHERRFLTRNQAHGSPGNLLDLYAAVDTPETEMFNRDRSTLVSKFASSAAHVMGRRRVSSETGTWLKEHFNERLADLKELIDQLFLAGVNHMFYHGAAYSPDDASWPGFLFYASTEMNPRNAIWRDVGTLNAYVARAQSMLQAGEPDNDILVYWPVYDVWHNPDGMALNFTVHRRAWLEDQPAGKFAHKLYDRGWAFDFVSDLQLASANLGRYRAIVVPATDHMPVRTLQRLLELARGGTTVIFDQRLPADVPGLGALENRRAEFQKLIAGVTERMGRGRVLIGDAEEGLQKAGVGRETLVDHAGLEVIRRASEFGREYFIVNRGSERLERWVPLAAAGAGVVLLDPMTGRSGRGAMRAPGSAGVQVYLQLDPGESIFARVFAKGKTTRGPEWVYWRAEEAGVAIDGPWDVRFVEGGPELPKPARIEQLVSWTEFANDPGQRFAGAARYTTTFDAPCRECFIELGDVRESARLRLNGRELGVLIAPPFRILAEGVKPRGNVLEVEVTNLSANRIHDLDRRKVEWRIFRDINFVNMDYKPFDASGWPLRESGLLGPVKAVPASHHRPG